MIARRLPSRENKPISTAPIGMWRKCSIVLGASVLAGAPSMCALVPAPTAVIATPANK
jgi:hypothetical protein